MDVTTHVKGKHHKEAASAAFSSRSMTSFFIRPQFRQSVTEAEARRFVYCKAQSFIPFQVIMPPQNYLRLCFPIMKLLNLLRVATPKRQPSKEAFSPISRRRRYVQPFFNNAGRI